jgi:hypothetical protein
MVCFVDRANPLSPPLSGDYRLSVLVSTHWTRGVGYATVNPVMEKRANDMPHRDEQYFYSRFH